MKRAASPQLRLAFDDAAPGIAPVRLRLVRSDPLAELPELAFAIKYYGKTAWVTWCIQLWDTFFAEGWRLVESVRHPTGPGEVDDLLRRAETAGWMERGKNPCMSISQAAFNGLQYSKAGARDASVLHHHASWFGWSPNRASKTFSAWLEEARAKEGSR